MPRMSLRQLLAVITVVALAIPSLKSASPTWQAIVYAIIMLAFMAGAVLGGRFARSINVRRTNSL